MSDETLIAILAAGKASRFGADKFAADCGGIPLGMRSFIAARGTGLPVIWIGSGISGAWAPPGCEIIVNPQAKQGMGTSVALAARTAQARKAKSLLILLADMPLVSSGLLAQLLRSKIPAACLYPGGKSGPPALFPDSAFGELMLLDGEQGAGQLLRSMKDVTLIEPPAIELLDVDTPADLEQAAGYFR